MECEACTDRMVELLYGDLPVEDADATRTHLDGCDACTETFGRVSTGHELASMLELVEPPVSVLDSVMAVAREKAAQLAPAHEAEEAPAQRATPPREDDGEVGIFAGFLRWAGGFAMRPQMAMAMTLVLMVGLGMWYVPTLQQSDPTDSHAIYDPAPGDEVGPSASLSPAEPLDLEADPVTGRILPRDPEEPLAAQQQRPPRHNVEPTTPPTAEVEAPPSEDPLLAEVGPTPTEEVRTEAVPPDVTEGHVIEEPLPDPRVAETTLDMAPGERVGPRAPATATAPRAAQQARSGQAARVQTAPLTAPSPQPSPPGAATATQRYERGVRRLRADDYRGAQDDFEAVVQRPDTDARRLLPSALHHLAQAQGEGGNCRAAVRTYQRLLSRHARYSGAPEAMIEAGVCYRRLGQLGESRRLFEQARTRTSTAARARRELTNLAARERAVDRASEAEEPASAEP